MLSVVIIIVCVCILVCCHFYSKYETHKKTLKTLQEIDKEAFYQGLHDALLLLSENKHKDISFNISKETTQPNPVLSVIFLKEQTQKEIISELQKILNEVSFALTLFSSKPNTHADILKRHPKEVKEDIIQRLMKIKGIENKKLFYSNNKWFYTADSYFSPIANLSAFTSCQEHLTEQRFISLQIKVYANENTFYGFCPSLYPGEEITKQKFIIDFNNA